MKISMLLAFLFMMGSVAFAGTEGSPKACSFKDLAKLKAHLAQHVTYPATGVQIKKACKQEMPDEFSKEEHQCVESTLSDAKSFQNSGEVLAALGVK